MVPYEMYNIYVNEAKQWERKYEQLYNQYQHQSSTNPKNADLFGTSSSQYAHQNNMYSMGTAGFPIAKPSV
jgi:endo-1,4-beta-mannosidase